MSKYCSNCGKELEQGVKYCPNCGASTGNNYSTDSNNNYNINSTEQPKSKLVAGLLGIFLGSLGVHNFYLGYTSKGLAQLLLTTIGWIALGLGPLISGIWSLIEGILILAGSINCDANGNMLKD